MKKLHLGLVYLPEITKTPKKPKPKRFTKDLHILTTDAEFNFVSSLNGGIGHHVRNFIDAQMEKHNKPLAELEKRLAVIEPEYLLLKKKIEELQLEEKKREDEERAKDKRVEDSHLKLWEAFKNNHYRIDLIEKKAWEVYSDFCGESIESLKKWVMEEAKRRGIPV